MTRITLLFTPSHIYLGEFTTRNGALVHCVLSTDGEQHMGRDVQAWQTQGIHSIHTKDEGFLAAFVGWAMDHGVETVQMSEAALPCWEKIVHLPFEPAERFSMVSVLSRLPAEEITQWNAALDEARKKLHAS